MQIYVEAIPAAMLLVDIQFSANGLRTGWCLFEGNLNYLISFSEMEYSVQAITDIALVLQKLQASIAQLF